MRLPSRLGLLLGFIIVANLPASTVLTCGSSLGNVTPTLAADNGTCYSLANFSKDFQTVDWLLAYGAADTSVPGHGVFTVTPSSGPWIAKPTANGLQVQATLFNPLASESLLSRHDNLPTVTNPLNWVGTFGTGDHLLAAQLGVLELNFDRGISGALFRISTPTSGAVYATVQAFDHINPVAGQTPYRTYSISASAESGFEMGPGGRCNGLQDSIPCDNAPFIGIEGGNLNIRSLVISSSNSGGGVLIDSLFADVPAPEPNTFALTGVVGLLAILGRRRMLRDRRS